MSNSSVGASRTGGRFARRRRGALRRALSIADVDGSGTIDRGEFLAALPLLRVGEAPSGPALDFIFADGEITFSSFLEMCVRVVDAHRVRRQCRDAVKKLLFIALVLLPAFTVAVSLVGGLVLYEVERSGSSDDLFRIFNVTSTSLQRERPRRFSAFLCSPRGTRQGEDTPSKISRVTLVLKFG